MVKSSELIQIINGKKEKVAIKRIGISDTLYTSEKGDIFSKTTENSYRLTDKYNSGSCFCKMNQDLIQKRMNEIRDAIRDTCSFSSSHPLILDIYAPQYNISI